MSSVKKLKITFFFDTISPYSYLCWQSLKSYKKPWNLHLEIKPVFLGGIMNTTGNKPPAMLPARAMFQGNDLARSAPLYNLDLLPSPGNFFSEAARKVLLVQRVLLGRVLDGAGEDELENTVSTAFRAIHADKSFRTDTNDLVLDDKAILRMLESSGLSSGAAQKALKRAGDADVKALLQSNTQEAVDAGAYGSPTLIIHGGKAPFYDGKNPWMVFGSDRFEQIAFICDLPYLGVNPAGRSKM